MTKFCGGISGVLLKAAGHGEAGVAHANFGRIVWAAGGGGNIEAFVVD